MSCFDILPPDIQRLVFCHYQDEDLNYLTSHDVYTSIIDNKTFQKLIFMRKYGNIGDMKISTIYYHLCQETRDGNLIIIKFMIGNIEDINFTGNKGSSSLLLLAVIYRHFRVANYLIDQGATFCGQEAHHLMWSSIIAVAKDKIDFLVQHGVDLNNVIENDGGALAETAVNNDNLPLLNFLAEQKSRPRKGSISSAISKAIIMNKIEALKILLTWINIDDIEHIGDRKLMLDSIIYASRQESTYESVLELSISSISPEVLEILVHMAHEREDVFLSCYLRRRQLRKERSLLSNRELILRYQQGFYH